MKNLLPSDLLRLAQSGKLPSGIVDIDTETSGLFVDSGARISTVSVAWEDDTGFPWLRLAFPGTTKTVTRVQDIGPGSIQTWGMEEIDDFEKAPVVSFAWALDQGVAGTGKAEDKGQGVLWADADNLDLDEWGALCDWLELVGQNTGHGYHNAKFDMHMFRAGVRRWPGCGVELLPYLRWDTQNGCDILYSRFVGGTSLKPTSAYLWGANETEEQGIIKAYLERKKLPTGRWDLMPWDVIAKYADDDARKTTRLRIRQQMELHIAAGVEGWLDGQEGRLTAQQAFERRMETTRFLYRMERRGLPYKVSLAEEASAAISQRIERLEKSLPFKPATLPMAKHFYFGRGTVKGVVGQELNPYRLTDTNAPAMDQAIVAKMVKDGVTGAETWRDIQKLQTADSKWYQGWIDRAGTDDRLRTSVRQNGTASGRFSVEGLQLHAIPHDYKLQNFEILEGIPSPRACIDAGVPEGFALWELDLRNAELRVAAMFAQCERMLALINEGRDIHSDAATELFGKTEADSDWGEYRQVAKRFDFSAIFGIGWEKLQEDVEEQTGIAFTDNETKELLSTWNKTYPEFKKAIAYHDEVVMSRYRNKKNKGMGFITLANGERRWFTQKDIRYFNKRSGRWEEGAHKAFNQRVQPSLAQFGIDWWLDVDQYLNQQPWIGGTEGAMLTLGTVLTVHDSMALLVPDDNRGIAAVEYATESGAALWRERFPGVPGGVDASAWSKHS